MSPKTFRIGDRSIGEDHPPFVIAEMSGNHNQSLERALAIVDAAADAGAHALKLQTYTADTMTLDRKDGAFFIADDKSLWKGRSLYDLYKEAATPWEWHAPLFERCKKRGMLGFSTPFDASAVRFLESLDVPAYKVASFENTDVELLREIARTGKPMIISTGMSTISDLDDTVSAARAGGCRDLVLLKCTSTYPATPESSNIRTIPHLRDLFDVQVGLSDHTAGVGAAVAAVALGATVIEKHFTLRRADGGVDSTFSLEPHELAQLVVESERAWQALGQIQYGIQPAEEKSAQFKRSLYVVKAVAAGERFSRDNVRAIRPGGGLAPKHIEAILGRTAAHDVPAGTPLSWALLA